MAFGTFVEWQIVFSTKVNLLYLLFSTAQRCCLLHLIQKNCFQKSFLGTLLLKIQVSLYLLTLQELIWNYIISVTLKMIKKIITNLDLSKVFDHDCIPVVILVFWIFFSKKSRISRKNQEKIGWKGEGEWEGIDRGWGIILHSFYFF